MQGEQKYIDAKHFIDRIILREMKVNRIGSISFLNQKPAKEVYVPENINDDSDEEEQTEKITVKEPQKMEYFMNEDLTEMMKKHYESLHFTWNQTDKIITISWS